MFHDGTFRDVTGFLKEQFNHDRKFRDGSFSDKMFCKGTFWDKTFWDKTFCDGILRSGMFCNWTLHIIA